MAKQVSLISGDRIVWFADLRRLNGSGEDDHRLLVEKGFQHDLLSNATGSKWCVRDIKQWFDIASMIWGFMLEDHFDTSPSDLIGYFGTLETWNVAIHMNEYMPCLPYGDRRAHYLILSWIVWSLITVDL